MLAITLHDLRYRLRQFGIAVVGAGLVFAMALLLTGLAESFETEIGRTIGSVGADSWVVPAGTTGPFTSFAGMPETTVNRVADLEGVAQADPLVVVPGSASTADGVQITRLIGSRPGGLGDIEPVEGRRPTAVGEAVVDDRLAVGLDEEFIIGGRDFTVVGIVHGNTLFAGSPNVYVRLRDAQAVAFNGAALVTTVLTRGAPQSVPSDLMALSADQVRADTQRVMADAVASIENNRTLMWVVAAVIVAALVYVSTLERTRDFAVMKSLGSSSFGVFAGVALQAVIVALAAAALAAAIANQMKPIMALPLVVPSTAFLFLPVAAVVVGVLSSLVAVRRAVIVDPAQAFAGM